MKKNSRNKIKISDKTFLMVYPNKNTIDIVHDDGTNRNIDTVYGDKFKMLRHFVMNAGLPAAVFKAQLAIKKMIANRDLWLMNGEEAKEKQHEASQLINMEKQLIDAFNSLSIYNTNQQRTNLDILTQKP